MRTVLEPGAVLESVAVFPLPQVVLFPGATMPLHIFEPRYRAMTRDALSGSGLLSVAQIPEGHGVDAHGNPEIPGMIGVGEIVQHERFDDGRYDIVVQGRARARVEEIPFVPPYRRARLTVVSTHPGDVTDTEARALRACALELAAALRVRHPAFRFALPGDASGGRVADLCAHYLVLDGSERQRLLETLDDGARVRRCTEVLMTQ